MTRYRTEPARRTRDREVLLSWRSAWRMGFATTVWMVAATVFIYALAFVAIGALAILGVA